MLQNPCKTLKEKYGLQNSPWGGGKPYPASGLYLYSPCSNRYKYLEMNILENGEQRRELLKHIY